MDDVLTEQTMSGFAPDASSSHATGSALDLRTASLGPSALREHMRRGSELGGIRPTDTAPDAAEAIELARIRKPEVSSLSSRRVTDVDSVAVDPGDAGVPSAVHDTDGASSSAPFVPPAERKRQRRKAMLCFTALCWSFFGQGWNDGSTGPLLPTIQRHYGVSWVSATATKCRDLRFSRLASRSSPYCSCSIPL